MQLKSFYTSSLDYSIEAANRWLKERPDINTKNSNVVVSSNQAQNWGVTIAYDDTDVDYMDDKKVNLI